MINNGLHQINTNVYSIHHTILNSILKLEVVLFVTVE